MRELDRREHAYREGRPLALVEGRTVILVDDGLATSSTMRAAVLADDVVCALTPVRRLLQDAQAIH